MNPFVEFVCSELGIPFSSPGAPPCFWPKEAALRNDDDVDDDDDELPSVDDLVVDTLLPNDQSQLRL